MTSKFWSIKRRRDREEDRFKNMGEHDEFLSRIKKTLYYGKLPLTDRFSLPVSKLAAEIFSDIKHRPSLEKLDLDNAAMISRNACVSPCSLVLAMIYLEKLKTCNPDYLQKVVPSELFLVSMLIASKFLHDDGVDDEVFNDEWALSAGIDVKEINKIERDFLQAISWEVFVSNEQFSKRLFGLEQDVALREGSQRGWFTYTDMDKLIQTVDLASMAQALILVSAVCITSYTVSVLTIFGATYIASQVPGTSISNSRIYPLTSLTPPLLSFHSNEIITSTHGLSSNIEQTIISSIISCPNNDTSDELVSFQRSLSNLLDDWLNVYWPYISLEGKYFYEQIDEGNHSQKSFDLSWSKKTPESSSINLIPYFTKWLKLSNHRWIQSHKFAEIFTH